MVGWVKSKCATMSLSLSSPAFKRERIRWRISSAIAFTKSLKSQHVVLLTIPAFRKLLLEKISTYLQRTRTGHLDHDLSAAFEQITCLAFKMIAQESQRAFGITIHQDTHQLNKILVFHNNGQGFFHVNLLSQSLGPR